MNSPAPSGQGARQRRLLLPADVSGFVGRSSELAQLADLLGSVRLVTVTGPGGVGKTRLALRAAASADGADGSCLVELSRLTDPGLVSDTVALRLGLRGARTTDALAAVIEDLRDRDLLLVLDTCEHLADACAQFAATMLRQTSGVRILATSRQPLHVPGEEVIRLGPLPVPGTDAASTVGAAGDAVELFTQRAAAAVSGFTLAPADLPHAIRLCRRLDGIPLAIELAAVRVRALPVAELAARIDTGLAGGIGTRRGATSRYQTLHAAIDWSYRLCTGAEKAAWRRLSVFAGTFDLAGAREVVSGGEVPPEQADEVVRCLVDKSVALPVRAGRYRLLNSVREYGAARLAEAGEDAECHDRYLARYLNLAREFSHRLIADGQQDRLGRLRAEHANIRRALEYGLSSVADAGPAPARDAARLAAALFPYWVMSGAIREGMRWQDKTLDRFTEPSSERASALANRALLGATAGFPDAPGQASDAIAMAARVGDERTQARAYLALQFALATSGRYPEALEGGQQARGGLEAIGAEHALRTLDMQLALTYVHARNFDAAIAQCQRLLRDLGPGERWLRGTAYALSALAYYQQPGRTAECAAAATTALAAGAGRCQRAAWLLGAAQVLWDRTGGRLSGSTVLDGHHQRAAANAAAALGEARFAELHAAGAARPLAQVVALAVAGADVLPDLPGLRALAEQPGHWAGSEELTARERQIAVLVARGLSNKDVADRLVISKRTVDAHVNHIFAKLGLSSRVQLAIWLRDQAPGLLDDDLPPAVRA